MIIVTMNNGDIFHIEAEYFMFFADDEPIEFRDEKGNCIKKPRYFVERSNGRRTIRPKGTCEIYLYADNVSSIEVLGND